MKRQLKIILLNQYIGAIIIAILWSQGVIALATLLGDPIFLLLARVLRSSNAPIAAPDSLLPLGVVVLSVLRAALNFIIGYLLALWLYADEQTVQATEPIDQKQQ
jgi:hypothetical protein